MEDRCAFEIQMAARGFKTVCGIDEAGCGPLAGPVYAAAVILNPQDPIEGLNDSKKLTEKRREALFEAICERALAWSVCAIEHDEIDRRNILEARLLAMRRAVEGLSIPPDFALVDGNRNPGLEAETLLIIGGDGLSASIGAASIVAKVLRDRRMCAEAERYPIYRFDKHKGYPTKLHYSLLDAHGPSPIHRQSFLHKWRARQGGGDL